MTTPPEVSLSRLPRQKCRRAPTDLNLLRGPRLPFQTLLAGPPQQLKRGVSLVVWRAPILNQKHPRKASDNALVNELHPAVLLQARFQS